MAYFVKTWVNIIYQALSEKKQKIILPLIMLFKAECNPCVSEACTFAEIGGYCLCNQNKFIPVIITFRV